MTEKRTCTFLDGRRRLRCTECGLTVDLCQCVDVDDAARNRLMSREGQLLSAIWREVWALEPAEHLDVKVIADYAEALKKIVQNDKDRSISDADIQRALVRVAARILQLTATGTPEYAYPSHDE